MKFRRQTLRYCSSCAQCEARCRSVPHEDVKRVAGCAGWAILGDVVRKVRNVLEGASGAAGSALLVDRTGGRHSLKRLVSAHTQPMQEQLPYLNRLSSSPTSYRRLRSHAFFFSYQHPVQFIRSSVSFPFSACLIEGGGFSAFSSDFPRPYWRQQTQSRPESFDQEIRIAPGNSLPRLLSSGKGLFSTKQLELQTGLEYTVFSL